MKRPFNRTRLIGLATIAITFIADQWSKSAILATFAPLAKSEHIPVLPFFDLVLWWNRGVSFGMLVHEHDYMPYVLTGLALIIAAGLVIWMWRAAGRNGRVLEAVALGMVIGGAVGNALDRLQYGAVVDFLYLYRGTWYWPAFNVADSAICVGVVMMLIFGSDLKKQKQQEAVGSGRKSA